MKKANITHKDLLEAARINARISDLSDIESACLERGGDISIIAKGK